MRQAMICLFFVVLVFSMPVSAAEYDRILAGMDQIVAENPGYVQKFDIGKNDRGETIYGIRIENPQFSGEKIPQLLVGAHHGNEGNTADLSLIFAKDVLAAMKESGHKLHARISRSVFYVIPVLNIDGFNAGRRTERNKTGSYIDPNRDYPDPCVHNTYYRLASTSNLASFVERYGIVGAVTAHGYIGTFTYPWGIYTDNPRTLDHDLFHQMATASVKENGYRVGTHTEVIYAASGSFEDWAYHKHGIWTMLLELSRSANLNNDSRAMLAYFALVPSTRSNQHQHTGNCTQTRVSEDEESRP